jgi:cytochrome c
MRVVQRWFLVGLAAGISGQSAGMSTSSASDLDYGKYLASECVTCHRARIDGAVIPAIVGLPKQEFVNALSDYRSGRRSNPLMESIANALDEAQIEALAAYFASLKIGEPDP